MQSGGSEQKSLVHGNTDREARSPVRPVMEDVGKTAAGPPKTALILFVIALEGFSLVLFSAMQQRFQRRMAILLVLVTIGLVEGVFQIEEFVFRRDRDRVSECYDEFIQRTGALPLKEDFNDSRPKLSSSYVIARQSEKNFTILWNRPLDPSFAIVYSSEDGSIQIRD